MLKFNRWNTFEALFIGGSKKDSAEKFLINYAKENGEFKKKELDGDIFYKRIDYSGSLIAGDEDYTELYIDELEVETES